MITLFNYLLVSGVFTSGFVLFKTRFEFYLAYVFMFLFLIFYLIYFGRPRISKPFIYTLTGVLALSFICVRLGTDTWMLFMKQYAAFIFNGLTYYLLFQMNKNDPEKIFRVYLRLALAMAVIGILQEISYLSGFAPGYDYSGFIHKFRVAGTVLGMLRVSAIMPEPAHFGAVMAPAMFISLLALTRRENRYLGKWSAVFIILSVLLTFSLVTYIGILVAVMLIMVNYRRAGLIIAGVLFIAVFITVTYRYLPLIKAKVDDTISVAMGKTPVGKVNVSTSSAGINALVACKSFLRNPLFGSGLGSHPLSYDQYIFQIANPTIYDVPLSKMDAGSLFFRLISETGLLGILSFFYFLARFYISRKRNESLWVISNAVLCLVAINLIRMGNYFYSGFILFIWLYYFTAKASANTPAGAANAGT
jgi:hypothetical protein